MSDGGKGCAPRPLSVSKEEFRERFDAIFPKIQSKYCDVCGKLFSWCECSTKNVKEQNEKSINNRT